MTRFPLAALAAVLAAGCWYDRPNPYDTSDDVEAYEEQREKILNMEALVPHARDQQPGGNFIDPDLEAWRDTVLAAADDETLQRIKTATTHKIGELKARVEDLWKVDPFNRKTLLTELIWQLRVEELRLSMVDDRLRSGAPKRNS